MSTYVTTGFVLSTRPWREGDRLYTLLTEANGKVEVIAAGSKKINSKLAPHLLPFAEVEVMVARGKRLDRLASASLRQAYLKPPYHLSTAVLGSALLEVADTLTRVGEREPRLTLLLRQSLVELAELPSAESEWRPAARWLLAHYLVELLKSIGLAVTLTHCEDCRGALAEPVHFSWTSHGFYHQNHVPTGEATVPLAPSAFAWLTRAATMGVVRAEPLPASVLGFLTDYVQGHAGRELYTLKVLRSIL